jgi:hypothetical protein
MRWAKTIGLITLGVVLGGLLGGYVVFQYMVRFGVDWNQWATSINDERRAGDALGRVAALTKLRAGNVEATRDILEMRLTIDVADLASLEKRGRDPKGNTTKAMSAIRSYRQANPWSSGNLELDKLTSDSLSDSASQSKPTR